MEKENRTRRLGVDHVFLLGGQFPNVHDQPLAVVLMVDRLHVHHCCLDPGFILYKKTTTVISVRQRHFLSGEHWQKQPDGCKVLSIGLMLGYFLNGHMHVSMSYFKMMWAEDKGPHSYSDQSPEMSLLEATCLSLCTWLWLHVPVWRTVVIFSKLQFLKSFVCWCLSNILIVAFLTWRFQF